MIRLFIYSLLLLYSNTLLAAPQTLGQNWNTTTQTEDQITSAAFLDLSLINPVYQVNLTGGEYWQSSSITIKETGDYVIDFKNTSFIGQFRHLVFDEQHKLIADIDGGLESKTQNPFFLRNGRAVTLNSGTYTIITKISSAFYLAQPEPYIDTLPDYQQAIKMGNAVVLCGIGIFIALGFYYATLSIIRRRLAEALYALFILGNLLFNSAAHLVLKDLFDLGWIYLAGGPILFSNIAYLFFVIALLEITPSRNRILYATGMASITLLSLFALFAFIAPNWTLEMARYGVGVFLAYGLMAGITIARRGNIIARLYLVAIAAFFILGLIAITQSQLSNTYTFKIEHIGLLAVAVEVILLALVISYQFAQLQQENINIHRKLVHSKRLAYTDPLTGLNNRLQLDQDLEKIQPETSLTFIDLDHLKYYNDEYGHAHGDKLLYHFAQQLVKRAGRHNCYRIGGDEFAIINQKGDIEKVSEIISQSIQHLKNNDFVFAGASHGSARRNESSSLSDLKHLADMRMYEDKHSRKRRLSSRSFGNIG